MPEPRKTAPVAEPVAAPQPASPARPEAQPLTARAIAKEAPVAAPETIEPTRDDQPVAPKLEDNAVTDVVEQETAKPIRERREVDPKAQEMKEVEPVKKRKEAKPRPRKQATPSGPVGRVAGRTTNRRTNTAGQASFSNYAGRVLAHLRRYKHYPSEADRAGLRGTVRLAFTVTRSGAVASVRIASGSGIAILDRSALNMVRRASPFPPVPADLNRSSVTFTVPIRFAP